MRKTVIILLSFLVPNAFSQVDSLSGIEILDRSIEHCGGMDAISKVETTELNYVLTTTDKIRVSLVDRRIAGTKFSQSIFSDSHTPQSTFFNGLEFARVNDKEIFKTDKIENFEEIKLRTNNQLQFGYKILDYQITRVPDKKFNNFDCFVLMAMSPNGYYTLNFSKCFANKIDITEIRT